jgi:hypothetical protein
MSIIGFPLLLIPVAICNIVVFMMPGVGFDAPVARLALPSGTVWTIAAGDMVVALGALLLLLEVIKAGRPGAKHVTDHLLSLLVFGGTVAEFVVLPQFGNATMFLLAILALVDVLAGIGLRDRRKRLAKRPAPTSRAPRDQPLREASPAGQEVSPASAAASSNSPSAAAASIAEAVLLDRPQPVTVAANVETSPQIQSPGLQPGDEAADTAPR